MRIELRDGQWAELRERITHAQDKEIKRVVHKAKTDDELLWLEVDTLVLRAFIRAWDVKDIDGNAIPLEDADAIERLPSDIADALNEPVFATYRGATVPNPPTPPSSADSSSANR